MNEEPRDAAEGYLTDAAYLRTYVPDLAPCWLRLVAAINGFPTPPERDFDYGELGFGSGDTLVTLAAAMPESRFFGVDLLPEHVAGATALARRGGVDNVRLIEGDFAELGGESLPSFDYVTAHGVLSWVSPSKRHAALDLASARLKPGGLLYVSYNTLPGWAAVEPLRRLLVDAGAAVAGDSLARARHGVRVASLLSEADAAYFQKNPASREMLSHMLAVGERYVAHEYLHSHWLPLYFIDVAREMAERGLYYVGQLPLPLNYRDLSLSTRQADLFKSVTSRVEFESLKDYALNQFYRRDVYIKGSATCTTEHTHTYLQSTPFTAVVRGEPIGRELALTHHTLHFEGPLFERLLPALETSAASAVELAQRPELASFGVRAIDDALLRVLLGGHVWPMRSSVPPRPAPAIHARYRLPLAYNRAILAELSTPLILASPVAVTGIQLTLLQAVCVRMLVEADPTRRPAWLHEFVRRHPLRLHVAEREVTEPAEQEGVIQQEFARFTGGWLAELVRLGVLEPDTPAPR